MPILPMTLTSQEHIELPYGLTASHCHCPASSGAISCIMRRYTPFMCSKSYLSEDLITLPLWYQVTSGSGRHVTEKQ